MTRDEQMGAIAGVMLNVIGWVTSVIPIIQLIALLLSCLVSLATLISYIRRKAANEPKDDRLFNNKL